MPVKIEQAFIDTFQGGSFGLDVAYENDGFSPKANKPFAELSVLEGDTLPYDLNTFNDVTGVFQVILRYPLGKGAIPAKQKADEILSLFRVGDTLQYDGQCVLITGHTSPSAFPEEGWFKLVRRINFRAFTDR